MAAPLIVALLGGPLVAAPAPADQPVRIDLEPGPLSRALQQLASLTQLQILYDPDLVRGLDTRGLHGELTPAKALQELLAATNLSFEFTAKDAVALHKEAHRPNAQPASAAAQVNTVTISTDRARENRYDTAATVTGVRIDESSMVVPIATASLTQQVLRERRAARVDDLLEFVSGAELVPDGQSASGFVLRGFPTYQYYLDDVRVSPDLHRDGFRDLANVERIEVMKGPASLLYGRTEPGGLINIITKQPLATPLLSLEEQAGSFGRRGTLLDAGGPLSSGGSLLYRFNAAWETSGSFRDIPNSRRIFVAPVLTWRASPRTETTAYLEYLNSHDPSDSGLPLIGTQPPPVPISRSLDEGGEIRTRDLRIGVRGSHVFGDGWTLHHHLDARWLTAPQAPQIAMGADGLVPIQCSANSCPVNRVLISIPVARGYTNYAAVDITDDLSFWHMKHSLLGGGEFFQTDSYNQVESTTPFDLTTQLFDPQRMPIPVSLFASPHDQNDLDVRERWASGYLQDQIAWGDEFYLLLGLRFDHAWTSVGQTHLTQFAGGLQLPNYLYRSHLAEALKYRAGFVWHPTPALSVYAKYTENFGVTPGLYIAASGNSDQAPGDQSATEWEAGVKVEFAAGRAAATLAAFHLTKQQISSALLEPALNPASDLYLTGDAKNIGLEFDLHGEIVPGLQLMANYAYLTSRIANPYYDNPSALGTVFRAYELIGRSGNRLFGVPRNGGSAWGSYRFAAGALQGLAVGAGVIVRGAREGDNLNDYTLPGFTRWSTFGSYSWNMRGSRMSVQLNIDNVLNTRYFESISGTHTVMPAAPRRWLGSVRVEF